MILLPSGMGVYSRPGSSVTYATLNPSDRSGGVALTNGNLTATASANNAGIARSTIKITGQRYFEAILANVTGTIATVAVGVATSAHSVTDALGFSSAQGWAFWGPSTGARHAGVTAVAGTGATGDVFGFAVDTATGQLRISKNGTWLNSGAAIWTNLSGDLYAAAGPWDSNNSVTMRFDPASWSYAAPSGYLPMTNP